MCSPKPQSYPVGMTKERSIPMKFVVLMENTAPEGACLSAEAGLSLYIEHRGHKLLLDAGSSGKFADNAAALGIDLSQVELAVLSHGHYDHSDGLRRFFAANQTAKVYARTGAGGPYFSTSQGSPRFIGVHRDIWEGFRDRFVLSDALSQPMEGVWLVPETVHGGPFASQETNLLRKVGQDQFVPDDFSHEQSLVLEGERGLVVFNSCSHRGIVNIVQGVRDQLQKPVCAMLAMGAGIIGPNMAERIVDVFLNTQFEGGRHARRVGLMMDIEKE